MACFIFYVRRPTLTQTMIHSRGMERDVEEVWKIFIRSRKRKPSTSISRKRIYIVWCIRYEKVSTENDKAHPSTVLFPYAIMEQREEVRLQSWRSFRQWKPPARTEKEKDEKRKRKKKETPTAPNFLSCEMSKSCHRAREVHHISA